jgi:hypothetical protein
MRSAARSMLLASLLSLGLGGCSEEAYVKRDLAGLLRCIQLGQQSCVAEMICTAYADGFTVQDFMSAAQTLGDSNPDRLKFLQKDTRDGDEQFVYELEGKTIYVTRCPEAYPGTFATVSITSGP